MLKLYHTILSLMALASIIYVGTDAYKIVERARTEQAGLDTNVTTAGTGDKKLTRPGLSHFKSVIERNIFSRVEKGPEMEYRSKIEELRPTSLNIALVGTVSGSGGEEAAIIEDTGKRKQGLYRTGDSIQEAVLKKILHGKVILEVHNRDEILVQQ